MVEELYHLRNRDILAPKLETIRKTPKQFARIIPTQKPFDKATVAILLYEFATGEGQEERKF